MTWLSEGAPADVLDIAIHKVEEKEVAAERQLSFVRGTVELNTVWGGSRSCILEQLGFRGARVDPENLIRHCPSPYRRGVLSVGLPTPRFNLLQLRKPGGVHRSKNPVKTMLHMLILGAGK
jgi:hypothetical protein